MEKIQIAIDGNAWVGKWATAQWIAKKLWYIYLDTWAMYRAVALYFLENWIDYFDNEQVQKWLQNIDKMLKIW